MNEDHSLRYLDALWQVGGSVYLMLNTSERGDLDAT